MVSSISVFLEQAVYFCGSFAYSDMTNYCSEHLWTQKNNHIAFTATHFLKYMYLPVCSAYMFFVIILFLLSALNS